MASLYTIVFCLVICSMAEQIRTFVEECELRLDHYECVGTYGEFLQNEENSLIRSLTISHSNLSELSKRDFAQFSNLTTITIINSSLTFPSQHHLFCGVRNLTELQITETNHSEDLFQTFSDNSNLVKLNLSDNKISYIRNSFFSTQRRIKEIDLSNNQIENIGEGSFSKLPLLRKLNISNNRLGKFFDPEFLSLASYVCAVCRKNDEPRTCSNDDHSRCTENRDMDQLWWISHAVSMQLRGNPLCSILLGETNTTPKENKTVENQNPGSKMCRVYEYGFCYKHESRRMFVLEACGVPKIFSSPIFERNSKFVVYPRERSESVSKPKSFDLDEYLFSAGLPVLIIGGIILVLVSAAVGSYVTMKDLKELDQLGQDRRERWDERRKGIKNGEQKSVYIPLKDMETGGRANNATNQDNSSRYSDSSFEAEDGMRDARKIENESELSGTNHKSICVV